MAVTLRCGVALRRWRVATVAVLLARDADGWAMIARWYLRRDNDNSLCIVHGRMAGLRFTTKIHLRRRRGIVIASSM